VKFDFTQILGEAKNCIVMDMAGVRGVRGEIERKTNCLSREKSCETS
jgi:hypothetical protein